MKHVANHYNKPMDCKKNRILNVLMNEYSTLLHK